jgi:23S rRNA pseudouridine1911/1915/1917 synthase
VEFPLTLTATPDDSGKRLDQFLAVRLADVSRSRIQQLIAAAEVRVNGAPAKASLKLRGDESIEVLGPPQPPPLRAMAEDIPLDVVYEDAHLAVINKPAGMMVHAGAGATEDARNRGTLVNALLHRFGKVSTGIDVLRPGIVHRLDKQTSGLVVIAKSDRAHRLLAEQFAARKVHKTYVALVHGWLKEDEGTINSPVGRDEKRRTRMTTGRGRSAVTHYRVLQRMEGRLGKFTLTEVKIETGRTHQIRVHMASVGHPVVGDTLYGAPEKLRGKRATAATIGRNFLHAAGIEFVHPETHRSLHLQAALPAELEEFLSSVSK